MYFCIVILNYLEFIGALVGMLYLWLEYRASIYYGLPEW